MFSWPETETPQSLFWPWKQHHFNASAFVVGKFGVLCLYQSIFQEMHTTHGKSTHVYHVSLWNLYLQTDLPSSTFKKTLVSRLKSQDFTKKAFKVLWKSPRFHQTKLPQKVGTTKSPPNSQLTYFNAQNWLKNIPTLQAFQVTSQEPKLRYNQLDTPAMTKRKRCHSVVFIVRLGPSAPFTNHKSSTQRVQRFFRHVFFLK